MRQVPLPNEGSNIHLGVSSERASISDESQSGLERPEHAALGQVIYQGEEELAVLRRIGIPSADGHPAGQSVPIAPILGHLIPGAGSCVIFFFDPIQHQLYPKAAANLSQEFLDALVDKEREEHLITAAIEQAKPHLAVYLPGNEQFKSMREIAHSEGIRTLWLVPWYRRDKGLAGVLMFASEQAFSPGKQALASAALLTELMSVVPDGVQEDVSVDVDTRRRITAAEHGQPELTAQERGEKAEDCDEEAFHPFTVVGRYTRSSATPMRKDRHGIPVIYDSATREDSSEQRQQDRNEPDAISVLSHELLSPLTLIKGYASTLLQLAEVITEEQSKQYLQGIQTATDRVIRLLENLRDISRLDIADPSLLLQPTSLPDLLRTAVFEIQSQTTEHVIKFRSSGPLPQVNVDRQKIEQVLTNLLMNAIKYSPQGGDIEAMVWQARDENELPEGLETVPSLQYPCLIVTISDSGIGIPESETERIFERFYRVNNRLTRATSGAGLGLHICKIIVEAHGGHIWARRNARGGSTFSFSVPVA
jgi:signal transduction histidine kinase